MNSLTYLSRQFDVLAFSRTPPNTPTTEFTAHPPLQSSSSADVSSLSHRAAEPTAWSLRSLVAPPPHPRRSLSSPARIPVHRRRPSIRSAIRAKSQPTSQSLFRRLFFVRLLELVWQALCNAAASLRVDDVWHARRLSPRGLRFQRRIAVLGREPSTDEQEGMALPAHQLGPEQAPTLPDSVANSPPSTHPSSVVNPPLVSRIATDPPTPDATIATRASLLAYAPPQPFAALMPTPPPSRTPTPTYSPAGLPIAPRKTPFHLPKTLVLDLDETLIHSTSRPLPAPGIRGLFGTRRGASHTVEVTMGGRHTTYHVYKRPFVDFFLRKVSAWYTLVIFTASMQEYADPVIDWLDAGQGILRRRFFRESCTQLPNGSYTKDLALVEKDLSRICLVDNSPICYSVNEMNGIPIEGWTHDPSDEALLDLLPVLDSLRFTSDVRRVLGIRGYS
ncbi:NLI interacting factor-like phosphatase-domain-containing protein [Russula brevipes]|nr:NLI interacting factor-like phosphatase-domain-containing protein [Russula brevipes]